MNDLVLIREGLINLIQKGDKLLVKTNIYSETYTKFTVKEVDESKIYFEEPYSIEKEYIRLVDNMLEGDGEYLINMHSRINYSPTIATTGTITTTGSNITWINNSSTSITTTNTILKF